MEVELEGTSLVRSILIALPRRRSRIHSLGTRLVPSMADHERTSFKCEVSLGAERIAHSCNKRLPVIHSFDLGGVVRPVG